MSGTQLAPTDRDWEKHPAVDSRQKAKEKRQIGNLEYGAQASQLKKETVSKVLNYVRNSENAKKVKDYE